MKVLFVTSLIFALSAAVSGDLPDLKGSLITLHTQVGDIIVQKLGIPGANKIPIIALPGAKPTLRHEWTHICEQLSDEHDYYVSIIHFDSKLKRNMRETAINIIHQAIFQNHASNHNQQKVIIMGKSVGGAIAQLYTDMYPTDILKLILVAPVLNDPLLIQSLSSHDVPILLLWTRDDTVASYSTNIRKWKDVFDPLAVDLLDEHKKKISPNLRLVQSAMGRKKSVHQFSLFSQAFGGHLILDDYFDPILSFLE